MKFEELHLIKPIMQALSEIGYDEPTPIQEQAIPPILEGRDVLGCAQTGTGKTCAFAVPILQRLCETRRENKSKDRPIRALVLTPTRELALQIFESFQDYGKHTGQHSTVVYGGVSQVPQVQAIHHGVDVLVATPGRLWDLMGQGIVDIGKIEYFVLDEADRMLDMGFIADVRRIVKKLPPVRQTLLFSATMPDEIADLADRMLQNPVHIEVTPPATTVEAVHQYVYQVDKSNKRALLRHVLQQNGLQQALVFTRTKHGADRVARDLVRSGISARAIHGDKSQGARQQALGDFKNGKICALVATDIAARGIDISGLPYVINFDLPNIPETYVHRIGRTGRAGLDGTAISFCDASELSYLVDIEMMINLRIEEVDDHPFPMTGEAAHESEEPRGRGSRGSHTRPGSGRSGGQSRQGGRGRGAQKQPQQKKQTTAAQEPTAAARQPQPTAATRQAQPSTANRQSGAVRQEGVSHTEGSASSANRRRRRRGGSSQTVQSRPDMSGQSAGRSVAAAQKSHEPGNISKNSRNSGEKREQNPAASVQKKRATRPQHGASKSAPRVNRGAQAEIRTAPVAERSASLSARIKAKVAAVLDRKA